MNKKITRKNSPMIKVCCLPEEKIHIEGLAKQCGLSSSTFLRNLATGYQPKSILDNDIAIELCKINGDLGRLGGLLKMLLTNDNRLKSLGKDEARETLKGLLQEIKTTQTLLFEKAKKI